MRYRETTFVVLACALDFCRALHERSRLMRWLFRLAVGRYAYREYELMVLRLEEGDHYPYMEYGLEGCDYHKKTLDELRET